MGGAADDDADDNPDGSEAGGGPKPDPMKAGFRDAGETCETCEYNMGGHCAMLDIPIGSGCNFYEGEGAGGGDMEAGGPGGGQAGGAGGRGAGGAGSPGAGGPPMAMGGMAPGMGRRMPPMPKRGM